MAKRRKAQAPKAATLRSLGQRIQILVAALLKLEEQRHVALVDLPEDEVAALGRQVNGAPPEQVETLLQELDRIVRGEG